jgi:hypothetical protein
VLELHAKYGRDGGPSHLLLTAQSGDAHYVSGLELDAS